MFELFQAGFDAQKRLLDIQLRQLRLFTEAMKAAQAQTGLSGAQSTILDNWLRLWGVHR